MNGAIGKLDSHPKSSSFVTGNTAELQELEEYLTELDEPIAKEIIIDERAI